MAATLDEVLLEVRAQLQTRDIDKGIKKLNTSWSKGMKAVQKASEKSMKGTGKAVATFFHRMGDAQKKYTPLIEAARKAQEQLTAEIGKTAARQIKAANVIKNHQKTLLALQKQKQDFTAKGNKESAANADAEIKDIEKKIKRVQELQKSYSEGTKAREQAIADADKSIKEMREQFSFDTDELNEAAVEAGQEIAGPFKALLDKDLKGGFEGGAKLAAAMIRKGVGGLGDKLMAGGAKMQARGTAMKGGGGGMAGVAGKGLELLGSFMQKMGPMLKSLAQIGPLASVLATSVLAIVKMFIDAEAAAKELNKEVLASAGSAEFLSQNFGSVKGAAADLGNTLADIRKSATSLDNLKWGISKAEHTATLNALTAEGVSLKQLEKEFKQVSAAAKDSAGYVKDWGTLTQMSVAYSRAFGVSLAELTQLEGELMGEIGMGVTSVQASFQYMTQAAEQAGMATNKFFGIIRGSTADMDLFNNRMEDSVKLLSQLGKVMTPRNAKQYMDTIKGYMKGMGLLDRLKSVLFAGGAKKVGGKVQSEHNRKLENLMQDMSQQIGKAGLDELRGIMKRNNPKEITKWMAKNDAKLTSGMREAIFKASREQGKLTKGGVEDVASTLKDQGPAFIIDHLNDIAKNMFGKPLEDLSGVDRLAVEAVMKLSDEQVDQYVNAAKAQELMKETLATKIETGAYLTAEEQKVVGKLGLKGADAAAQAADLRGRKSEDIWDKMSADQKAELENSKKQIDYQKETAGYTQSAMDKLSVIVEWLMNQLYKVMLGIWDAVLSIPGVSADVGKAQLEVAKTGNKQLIELADKYDNVMDMKAGLMSGNAAKEIERILGKEGDAERERLMGAVADLRRQQEGAKTPEAKASYEAQLKAAEKARLAFETKHMAATTAQSKLKDAGPGESIESVKAMSEALADFAKQFETDPTKIKAEQEKAVKSGTGEALAENPALKAGDPSKKSMSVYDFYADEAATTLMTQNEEMTGILLDAADSLDEMLRVLRFKGIKIADIGNEKAPDAIENAVLEAARTALIEYYMYKELDPADVSDAITRGVKPNQIGAGMIKAAKGTLNEKGEIDTKGKVGVEALGGLHADGGLVTGVREGIALVAKGEAIVPAGGGMKGGGGQTITIEFQGDAKKLIRAVASDTYYENKGRERFR